MIANAIEFVSFNLKEGASVPDFILASDKMNTEFLMARKGYISRQLIISGELWADYVLWETMEDALDAAEAFGEHDADRAYMSFLDMESIDMHHFYVEKSY